MAAHAAPNVCVAREPRAGGNSRKGEELKVWVTENAEPLEGLDPGAVLDDPLYTPQEIAQALRVSDDYVRRLFERQPGVIFLPSPGKESKRRHRTMRVPRSVLLRLCNGCKMGAT